MDRQPVRVGISGSYGELNLGDEAVLEVIVRQLRASVSVEITVFTRDVEDPNNRKLVAKHLNRAAAITVRDRQSVKLLEEVGVEREIVLTADPALLLEPEPGSFSRNLWLSRRQGHGSRRAPDAA